ncbi:hypothetical protein Trydic_g19137 [Trypoxylus dichotomus]
MSRAELGDVIKGAANVVLERRLSLRKAARTYSITKSTLSRHLLKFKRFGMEQSEYEASNAVSKFFKNSNEQLLRYLLMVAKMGDSLNVDETGKLAFELSEQNNLKYPPTSDENKKAGTQWCSDLIKYSTEITLPKPEASSLTKSASFNRYDVSQFLKNA